MPTIDSQRAMESGILDPGGKWAAAYTSLLVRKGGPNESFLR
jgi:hypothetical protein